MEALLTRRIALASVAVAVFPRRASAEPRAKFHSPVESPPICSSKAVEEMRKEWATEAGRRARIAKEATMTADLYAYIAGDDLEAAFEVVNDMRDAGFEVSEFETDVRLAVSSSKCYVA